MEARALDRAIVTLGDNHPSAIELSRPRMHWVASPGFAVEDWDPVPIAWFHENSILRSSGLAALENSRVAFREVLSSSQEQVVLCALSAGTAVTVLAEGTVPPGLRII